MPGDSVVVQLIKSALLFREFSLLPRVLFFFGVLVCGIALGRGLEITVPLLAGSTFISVAFTLHYGVKVWCMDREAPYKHHWCLQNLLGALACSIVTIALLVSVASLRANIPVDAQLRSAMMFFMAALFECSPTIRITSYLAGVCGLIYYFVCVYDPFLWRKPATMTNVLAQNLVRLTAGCTIAFLLASATVRLLVRVISLGGELMGHHH